MANHILTLTELEEIFWSWTMRILGLDPESQDKVTQSKVRRSWPADGSPSWSFDEDVCFLAITESDDGVNRQKRKQYEQTEQGLVEVLEYTKVISCSFVFYGPRAYDNASMVRDLLSSSNSHYEFAKHKIYYIPDAPAPMRAPELFSGRWWERADLRAEFNAYVRREVPVGTIESVEITIKNEEREKNDTIKHE